MKPIPTLSILIPHFNEADRFSRFFSELTQSLPSYWQHSGLQPLLFNIIVVDDGSKKPLRAGDLTLMAQTAPTSTGASQAEDGTAVSAVRAFLLKHPINMGQGAALATAIEFARDHRHSDYFVTMDSDGQHRLDDLASLVAPVLKGEADIAFGNRFKGQVSEQMPALRKILLKGAILFEFAITGLKLKDAHNGYRAFNRTAASCLEIRQNRMAHATEFKQIVSRNKLRYCEVPVSIAYSTETLEKGQSNMGSFTILKDLLKVYLFGG